MKIPIGSEFEWGALVVVGCIIGALLVLIIAFLRQWLA